MIKRSRRVMCRLILPVLFLGAGTFANAKVVSSASIEFVGPVAKSEFRSQFQSAFERLSKFVEREHWKTSVQLSNLIRKVEVYATKAQFDQKLMDLSDGKMKSIPETYVGLADRGVLRVVSWEAYKKVHPKDSVVDYEKLLAHEMAHQFHVALLKGDENLMGPTWFYEGFATLAADQYAGVTPPPVTVIKEWIKRTEGGNYPEYNQILKALVRAKPLPDLIEMAKAPDFVDQCLALLESRGKI